MSEDLTTSERLARMEVEVEGMRVQFGGRFTALENKLDLLAANLAEGRKPRWDTWAAYLMVGFAVVGGGSWIISERFDYMDDKQREDITAVASRAESNRSLIHELQRDQAVHTAKLVEIETQFKSLSNITNLQHSSDRMLIDQLWQAHFGKELQQYIPYPVIGNGSH